MSPEREGGVLPISPTYRDLQETIEVITEHAPDLHDVLEQSRVRGWPHLLLDGTLMSRVSSLVQSGGTGQRPRHHRPPAPTVGVRCPPPPTAECAPGRQGKAPVTVAGTGVDTRPDLTLAAVAWGRVDVSLCQSVRSSAARTMVSVSIPW